MRQGEEKQLSLSVSRGGRENRMSQQEASMNALADAATSTASTASTARAASSRPGAIAHRAETPHPAASQGDASRAPAAYQPATRIQRSVLTGLEKRTLLWLAHRMPAAINSDHLTVLAFVAMLGVGLSYWLSSVTPIGLVLATLLLAVNWFGDSLDGTLARVRNHQRPRYGYYVDHVVDVTGTLFLFGGLALSGIMSPPVAAALTIAYFLVSLEVYLATNSLGIFQMSFFGVGPTELRILLALGNVALLVRGSETVLGTSFTLFDIGGIAGTVGLLATFVYSAVRNTRTLYRAEPLPGRTPR
jgi:phosphatidylglycerophosphate synthase